jgi:hypothetical protein
MVPSNPRGRGVPSTAAVTIARIFAIQPKRSGYLLRDNIEVLYFEVLHYFEFSPTSAERRGMTCEQI